MKWNNISNPSLIYVGQVLKLNTTSTTTTPKPVVTTPAPKPVETNTTYTVKSGDTLWGISVKNNVSVSAIKSWNNLKSDIITPGQKLIVKQSTQSTQSTQSPKPAVQAPKVKTHVVKSGDTLWGIATSNKTTINKLKADNNLKSSIIFIGQKIVIK